VDPCRPGPRPPEAIWQQLAPVHRDVLVAVPDTYTEPQLELLAGIMKALAIPVDGFVSHALAALPKDAPRKFCCTSISTCTAPF
jgi:hypothetical protein